MQNHIRHSIAFLTAAAFIIASGQVATAQTLAEWNFNVGTAFLTPTSGVNAAGSSLVGYGQSNSPAPFSSVLTNGTPADPGTDTGGTVYNYAAIVNPPLTSTSNLSVGTRINVDTTGTAGQTIQANWSMTVGWRSSRYWQILATTDGTTFSPVTGGTGSSFSGTINGLANPSPYTPIAGTANVTIDGNGLIDFRTIQDNSLLPSSTSASPISNYDVGFVNNLSFTFPTGQGFENNPNFGFAIVGAFDPAYGGADGALGYKSSVAGTDSLDTVNGYNRATGSGGSMRIDLMSVSAAVPVPEPANLALLGLGTAAAFAGIVRGRHRWFFTGFRGNRGLSDLCAE